MDMDYLFMVLQQTYHKTLIKRKSVIIFDEVQKCPMARQAIKYLVQDGRYDYIETGSLISIKKNTEGITIPSEEDSLQMYQFSSRISGRYLIYTKDLGRDGQVRMVPAYMTPII